MKTFIVSNISRKDSLANARIAAESCDKFNVKYTLFPGVDGDKAHAAAAEYGLTFRTDEWFRANCPTKHMIECRIDDSKRPGVWGCFMSHYILWLKCVEMNEPFLILEHDGVLIKEIPDDLEFEDVLHLDPLRCNSEKRHKYDNQHHRNMKVMNDDMFGSHAYIVKPRAAKALLDMASEEGIMAADGFIYDASRFGRIVIRGCFPPLAGLDNSFIAAKASLTYNWR